MNEVSRKVYFMLSACLLFRWCFSYKNEYKFDDAVYFKKKKNDEQQDKKEGKKDAA
jgi:hypothetical protein